MKNFLPILIVICATSGFSENSASNGEILSLQSKACKSGGFSAQGACAKFCAADERYLSCEETVLKTNDLMIKCNEGHEAQFKAYLDGEKYRHFAGCKEQFEFESNRRSAYNECVSKSMDISLESCQQTCSLTYATCESAILKATDLMVKCTDQDAYRFQKLFQAQYHACKGLSQSSHSPTENPEVAQRAAFENKWKRFLSEKPRLEALKIEDLRTLADFFKSLEEEGTRVPAA